MSDPLPRRRPPEHQPIFNLPSVIVGVLVVILGIQAILSFVLSPDAYVRVILGFRLRPRRARPLPRPCR